MPFLHCRHGISTGFAAKIYAHKLCSQLVDGTVTRDFIIAASCVVRWVCAIHVGHWRDSGFVSAHSFIGLIFRKNHLDYDDMVEQVSKTHSLATSVLNFDFQISII